MIDHALALSDPDLPYQETRSVIDAAIELYEAPVRRYKAIEMAAKEALVTLPVGARGWGKLSGWDLEAMEAARVDLNKLPMHASPSEMKAVAERAVRPIGQRFLHQQLVEQIIEWFWVRGATSEERESTRKKLRGELMARPVGTSREEMKKIAETHRHRLELKVEEREDMELRESVVERTSFPFGMREDQKSKAMAAVPRAVASQPEGATRVALEQARDAALQPYLNRHELATRKEKLIEQGTDVILPHLRELQKQCKFESDTSTLQTELNPIVEHELQERLLGNETSEKVHKLVKQLIANALDVGE